MALPTEPGVYSDAHGDLWLLRDEDGLWQHIERRMSDGRGWPVRDYPPAEAWAVEKLAVRSGDVLPFKRVTVDVPNDLQ